MYASPSNKTTKKNVSRCNILTVILEPIPYV